MRRLTLLALVVAAPAFAQPPGREAPDYAPFIDEHTLVVARVDVSRVDVETALKLAGAIAGEGDEVGAAADAVRGSVKRFLEAGGRNVFVTYGPGDFPHLPCLIAPAPEAADQAVGDQLVGLFKAADKEARWTALHGCVCVGTKEALAVLKARKPVARADLAAALDAGADGVVQVAFALSRRGQEDPRAGGPDPATRARRRGHPEGHPRDEVDGPRGRARAQDAGEMDHRVRQPGGGRRPEGGRAAGPAGGRGRTAPGRRRARAGGQAARTACSTTRGRPRRGPG